MQKDFLQEVFGYDHIKEELFQIKSWITNEEIRNNKLIHLPKGILFYGKAGNGKTMMMRLYAASFNCPIFNVKGAEDEIAEIQEVFAKARQEKFAIVTIDELDRLVDNEPAVARVIQSEIDGLDQSGRVLVLATANEIFILNGPISRKGRFDRVMEMLEPDKPTIQLLYKQTFETLGLDYSDLDMDYMTQLMLGRSGADIKILVNDIYLRAGNNKVTMKNFEDSFEHLFSNINDLKDNSTRANRTVAIHEAGHILSILRFANNFDFYKAYFNDRGGATEQISKSDFDNRESRTQKAIIDLSGYAAERLILGKNDIGAYFDLKEAKDIVRRLVEKSACLSIDHYNESYDYDMSSRTNSIAHQIKNEKIIIKYTEKLYKNAYKYLKKNKKALLKIADLLLEKKVIYKKDLELSLKDYSIFDKQKKN